MKDIDKTVENVDLFDAIFSDFEGYCARRFYDNSLCAHLGLLEHVSCNATENDFAAISLTAYDVERTRIAAILLVPCSCQVTPSKVRHQRMLALARNQSRGGSNE